MSRATLFAQKTVLNALGNKKVSIDSKIGFKRNILS
jgi:hypothetical protein